jgi:hypothetical protein
VERKATQP